MICMEIVLRGYLKYMRGVFLGSHWVANLLHFLLQPGPLDKIDSVTPVPAMEMIPEDVAEAMPSPRVLHSHSLPADLPPEVFEKDRKVIITVRNPKDTAVSTFYHAMKDPFFGQVSLKWKVFIESWIKGLCKFLDFKDLFEWLEI